MDPRLLRHYNQELQHVREMGAEFAAEFPKIAGRLRMDGLEVADPYVERLLEGFAFLTARLQLRIDSEYPRFTQRLLEILYPQFLAPVPSMLIAQVQPKVGDQALAAGVTLPRGSLMRGRASVSATPCEFTTGSALTLWPVDVAAVEYFTHASDLPPTSTLGGRRPAGGVRIRLRCSAGLDFGKVAWRDLRFCCSGGNAIAFRLHELVAGSAFAVLARTPGQGSAQMVAGSSVAPVGLDDEDALLPVTPRGFAGYRLLQEYFALPQKFLFFDVLNAGAALRRIGGTEVEIVLLLSRADAALQQAVDASSLALHCVPAINLFERRCDRIHVTSHTNDFHVVPDRMRPMDFEVHQVLEVTGHGTGKAAERRFQPLYGAFYDDASGPAAYFTTQREPRMLSDGQKREGPRSSYVGSEVFLSIVDAQEAPYSDDLQQLAVRALCTNRDLPLHLASSQGSRELHLQASAPVTGARVLRGPTRPQPAVREGDSAWKLINQFSLHHTSLSEASAAEGASALRAMLRLYVPEGDAAAQRQVDGIRSIRSSPVVRRLPMPGPIAFGRGVQIDMDVDEHAFEGGSAFLLGAVLERFFARHVSLNAFTVLRVQSAISGLIFEGRPQCGKRPIL